MLLFQEFLDYLPLVLSSIFLGVVLTLVIQGFLLKRWFLSLPGTGGKPVKPQYDNFGLPKELLDALHLSNPELAKKRESCICLNLIFQFLFRELRDTERIRSWVKKKMNVEFAEMLQTTTGKLLDQIMVRDFNLGGTFPVVKSAALHNVVLNKDDSLLDEVTLQVDLTYHGGFQLAVDVDLVFGKSAYLSVKVTKLQGVARLQFNRIPYTHWSFTFVDDPVIEFEVDSHFEGRSIPQITSLIINQIRRSVRKKHTLPNYKFRYKPFFIKPACQTPTQDIYYQGKKLCVGTLEVTVVQCSRLHKMEKQDDAKLYVTLALDSMPWIELMNSRQKLWVGRDVELIKVAGMAIGITFQEEFILDKYEDMVVVDSIVPDSAASRSGLRKNDIVMAVNGVKVTGSKQAAKLLKQAPERVIIKVDRSSSLRDLPTGLSDFKVEEDTVSLSKDSDFTSDFPSAIRDSNEDFINITITPVDSGKETAARGDNDSALERAAGCSLASGNGSLRKPGKVESESYQTPPGSPALMTQKKPRSASKTEAVGPPPGYQKKRSKSDTTPILRETERLRQLAAEKGDASSLDGSEGASAASTEGESESMEPPDVFEMRKTQFVKASEAAVFQEKFIFEIEEKHSYLNMCLWCKTPEKRDKQGRVVKNEKDTLLGHVSVSLMDVSLECLATLQGDTRHTYSLTPAEIKTGASRNKFSGLAAHPGFDEKLCHGDLTLAFKHSTWMRNLTNHDKCLIEKMQTQHEEATTLEKAEETVQEAEQSKSSRTSHVVEPGKHDFLVTSFQTVTYCNFCRKKIWLKSAFQCSQCKMVCHKKCMEKCQAQTMCEKGSYKFRDILSPVKKPPAATKSVRVQESKADEGDAAQLQQQQQQQLQQPKMSSIFSKFRKDSAKPDKGASHSPGSSPNASRRSPSPSLSMEGKRRTSVSDDGCSGSMSDSEQTSKSKLDVPGSTRRQSRTLTDFVEQNGLSGVDVGVRRSRDALTQSGPEASSSDLSDSDDEMNLLKVYEQQKASQNADEMVVMAAKQMGKELYTYLSPEERRSKLDGMISKLQQDIDLESENRAELGRQERETSNPAQKSAIRTKIEKSDEKIQSLALLMLHYCAGLQHCLDKQEQDRQKKELEMRKDKDQVQGISSYASKMTVRCRNSISVDDEDSSSGDAENATSKEANLEQVQNTGTEEGEPGEDNERDEAREQVGDNERGDDGEQDGDSERDEDSSVGVEQELKGKDVTKQTVVNGNHKKGRVSDKAVEEDVKLDSDGVKDVNVAMIGEASAVSELKVETEGSLEGLAKLAEPYGIVQQKTDSESPLEERRYLEL